MAELRVRVDAGLAAALSAEADRLGFDSRQAYVRWLLDRRAALDAAREADPDDPDGPAGPADPDVPEGRNASGRGDGDRAGRGDGDRAGRGDGDRAGRGADGRESTPPRGDGGGRGVGSAAAGEVGLAASVAPGRVSRSEDEGVAEAAARLGDVERDRVDAMLRLARGRACDERPGSDLADLDALDVPGRDEALVDRRRRLVGAGLAYLREAGEARRSEFVAALREEYPAGYDSVAGWWRCLSAGLRQVDRVRDADADVRTWRFRDARGRIHVSADWE